MEDVVGALGGFRGVRADLLVALKKAQPVTAGELGEQFGLTANALRRHLKALEEDGLVRYRREVRGVGAPVYAYSLTAADLNGQRWLAIRVGDSSEDLTPRLVVGATPFAIVATRAESAAEADKANDVVCAGCIGTTDLAALAVTNVPV